MLLHTKRHFDERNSLLRLLLVSSDRQEYVGGHGPAGRLLPGSPDIVRKPRKDLSRNAKREVQLLRGKPVLFCFGSANLSARGSVNIVFPLPYWWAAPEWVVVIALVMVSAVGVPSGE